MSTKFKLQARQTQSFRMGQIVSLMQMTVEELDAHLSEAAQNNPMLIFKRRLSNGGATDILETTAVETCTSLYDHVFRELAGLIAQGGLMETLITALIAELEPSGWLGASTEDISEALQVSKSLIDTALRVVQKRVEPAGLFARNLEECLRLQLEDRDALDPDMDAVLSNLAMLEQGGIAAISVQTGVNEDKVHTCLAMIRTLDPKPGSAFVSDPALRREPDVRVVPSGRGWTIEFLSSHQDNVEIVSLPRGKSQETREALAQARALKQAYDLRRSALQQVVETLVDHQSAFFRDGPEALSPLTLGAVAQATGFHLSTVSRVLNGLLIEGPNGIIAARSLFSGAASAHTMHAKPKVQARIRALLTSEDPEKPLSDRRLVVLLKREGITVSRRVVSNYRDEIGIPSAPKRRSRVHA